MEKRERHRKGKQRLAAMLLGVLMLSTFVPSASASESIRLFFDKKEMQIRSKLNVMNGKVLVPMREVFEQLGAKVEWDGETKTITTTKDDTKAKMTIDQNVIYVNDIAKKLDCSVLLIDGQTFVPLAVISEALGYQVDWDDAEKTVSIDNIRTWQIEAVSIDSNDTLILTLSNGEQVNLGLGIRNLEVSKNGKFLVTYTNGKQKEIGNIKGDTGAAGAKGATGAQGVRGKQGEAGPQGPAGRGIHHMEFNSAGELIVYFTDDTQQNLGRVPTGGGSEEPEKPEEPIDEPENPNPPAGDDPAEGEEKAEENPIEGGETENSAEETVLC